VYCSAKLGKSISSHTTFSAKGKLCCRRLANDISNSDELLQQAREIVSNYSNKGNKYYLSLTLQHRDCEIDRNIVIADCGATRHMFNNKRWFRSLHYVTRDILGVGGAIKVSAQGETMFGQAFLCETLPFSLLSTNQLHDDGKRGKAITLDWNKADNTFIVSAAGQTFLFKAQDHLNVPSCVITPRLEVASSALLASASPEDMRKARLARDLHYSLSLTPP
jgi:hypothetical protein